MAAPTQVAGLTVISVSDAIAIRDAGVDGRELAVHGWLTRQLRTDESCGDPRHRPFLRSS